MFSIYLICLIVGGVLILTSIIFGGHHDMEAGHDLDAAHDVDVSHEIEAGHDVDVGHDIDASHEIEAVHDVDADNEVEAGHDADVAGHEIPEGKVESRSRWLPFLSLRFWIFLIGFFGFSGTLITLLKALNPIVTFVFSLGMGFFSGLGISYVVRYFNMNVLDSTVRGIDMIGDTGRVITPISKDSKGQIRLLRSGEVIDLIAATDENLEFKEGEEVSILEFKEGVAHVVKLIK